MFQTPLLLVVMVTLQRLVITASLGILKKEMQDYPPASPLLFLIAKKLD
jgi:hypothetical protein